MPAAPGYTPSNSYPGTNGSQGAMLELQYQAGGWSVLSCPTAYSNAANGGQDVTANLQRTFGSGYATTLGFFGYQKFIGTWDFVNGPEGAPSYSARYSQYVAGTRTGRGYLNESAVVGARRWSGHYGCGGNWASATSWALPAKGQEIPANQVAMYHCGLYCPSGTWQLVSHARFRGWPTNSTVWLRDSVGLYWITGYNEVCADGHATWVDWKMLYNQGTGQGNAILSQDDVD